VYVEGLSRREAAVRDRPEDGGENAGVLGPAGISAEPADGAAEAGAFGGVIDRILEEDKRRPAKQQHTAKRIFERLRDEYGYGDGIKIVRAYVHEQRQRLRELFVPLRHDPGHAQPTSATGSP
jgi:hypothetical protein